MIDSNNPQFCRWAVSQLSVEYVGFLMAEFRHTHKLVRIPRIPASIPLNDKLIQQFDKTAPKEV